MYLHMYNIIVIACVLTVLILTVVEIHEKRN